MQCTGPAAGYPGGPWGNTLMKILIFFIANALAWAQSTPGLLGPPSGTGGGTAQAQTVSFPQVWSLAANQPQVCWLPSNANSGAAPTLTITSNGVALTAHTIVKAGGAVVANDIIPTRVACVIYNPTGTQFELQNPQTVSGGGGSNLPYTSCATQAVAGRLTQPADATLDTLSTFEQSPQTAWR